MTLQDFINEWTGKPCNPDNFAGNQCVDLADQYAIEVVGKPLPLLGNNGAIHFWDLNIGGYDKITNTPTGVPQPGDIMIFGSEVGPYGHIDIFVSGDANSFTSFSQNWPVQGYVDNNGIFIGTGTPHLQSHTWVTTSGQQEVLGWFHPQMQITTEISVDKATFENLVTKSTEDDAYKALNYGSPEEIKTTIDNLNEHSNNLTLQITDLTSQLSAANLQIEDLKTQLANLPPTTPQPPSNPPELTPETVLVYLKTLRFWQKIHLFAKS